MTLRPYSAQSLKRSGWHFLSGKAVSGLLTFGLLLWIVRLLPVTEYGAYVTLISLGELAFAIFGFGIPWAAARYLPSLRLHAAPGVLRQCIFLLLKLQISVFGACLLVVVLARHVLTGWLDLSLSPALMALWLALIAIEGTGRFVRDGLLGPLVQQGIVRLSVVGQQLFAFLMLTYLGLSREVELVDVVSVLAAAALLGLLIAGVGLGRHIAGLPDSETVAAWTPPTIRELWLTSLPMYSAHLLSLLYSPQLFLLLIQRAAGNEAAAVFGFMRSLYEQGARYLPATLLFSLVRPKLVVSYGIDQNKLQLFRDANMAGKLSLFFLMPAIALCVVIGADLVQLLSSGKFPGTGLLMAAFLVTLIPYSQRQVLETVSVVTGHGVVCVFAAAAGSLALLLMLGLLQANLGLWAAVVGLGMGHLLFAAVVATALRYQIGYKPDYLAFGKLCLATASATVVAILAPVQSEDLGGMAVIVGVTTLAFLVVAWTLKPFTLDERARLNGMLGHRLFVW